MEERFRLGRGLKEISQVYLSDTARNEIKRHGKLKTVSGPRTVIRVCHPGSCLVQSFFLANLALELAKNRFSVYVWDGLDSSPVGMEAVMKSIVLDRKEDEAATVRLYGLPDILIYGPQRHDTDKLADLVRIVHASDNDRYLLVSADGSLASAMNDDIHAEHILLSGTDEKSLLQCYAHIRVILDKGSASGIFIVFDGVGHEKAAQETFERFAAFIDKKLNYTIDYLGNLSHDESLERSVEETKPLMLSQDRSETKDDMVSISRKFIHSRKTHDNS
ncbi:MAG TPA: hypothetical protein ENN05_02980 [Deltaproteobacteria bacterium]|nr:hypothetical protein [Deltaproteobacteria bacterium]